METEGQQKCRCLKTIGKIGHGCQGEVYQVEDENTHERFALKVVEIKGGGSGKDRERIELQVQLNMKLSSDPLCSNFPKLHDYWFQGGKICLLFERCEQNAQIYIKRLPSYTSRYNFLISLLFDTLQALLVLHSQQVIHRDIKAENILIKRGKCKLADFGLSRIYHGGGHLTNNIGNRLGRSPQFHSGNYSTKADIWSLGVHVFYMLEGTLPFDSQSIRAIQSNPNDIQRVLSSGKISVDFSPQGRKSKNTLTFLHLILADMIVVEPTYRADASSLLSRYFDPTAWKTNVVGRSLCGFLGRDELHLEYLMALAGWIQFSRNDSKLTKEASDSNRAKICLKVKTTLYCIFHMALTHWSADSHNDLPSLLSYILGQWKTDLERRLSEDELRGITPIVSIEEAVGIYRISKVAEKFPLLEWVFKPFQQEIKLKTQFKNTRIRLFDTNIEIHKLL